jgi:hypothetical protein
LRSPETRDKSSTSSGHEEWIIRGELNGEVVALGSYLVGSLLPAPIFFGTAYFF